MQQIDLNKVVDEAKFNRFHAVVLAWCMLIIIIDGYDLVVAGVALPSIMNDMGVDSTTAGLMASSALFGMVFGAIGLGMAADRIGRRWTMAICIFLFSASTAAAGTADDPITFSVFRFLAGLGIGGVMPIVTAQMTDYSPRAVRSRLVSLVMVGYGIGGMLAAVLGKQFILTNGWQSVFYVAILPILLIPFVLKWMPESLQYLLKRSDDADLRRIVGKLDPSIRLAKEHRFLRDEKGIQTNSSLTDLFMHGRGLSTVMFWIAFASSLFVMYALTTWLTQLMARAGHSLGSALNFMLAFNGGAILGAIVGSWVADKLNIKYVLVTMYVLGASFLYALSMPLSLPMLYLAVVLVGANSGGANVITYAYCGQYYPRPIRATGVGFASGVGRVGAILAPIVIGFIVSLNRPVGENFMLISAIALLGGLAIACTRLEATRQSDPLTKITAC